MTRIPVLDVIRIASIWSSEELATGWPAVVMQDKIVYVIAASCLEFFSGR